MADDTSFRVENVRKRYGRGACSIEALRGMTLSAQIGEFVAIVGPSGSGKSTLLNLLAGLDRPDDGCVWTLGRNLDALSDDARSDLRLREIGFVFQAYNLFPTFTAAANVGWPLELAGIRRREVRTRVHAVFEQVGLRAELTSRRPAQMSGGEQQRVAVARALVSQPRLVLADEPTGNLDSGTGRQLLTLLRTLISERQTTVVLVTHSDEAASFADRVVKMRDGCMVD